MYPSVRVKLIQKALNHYARDLPDKAKKTIKQCMDIIHFGMKSTLIQFQGKYCVYRGEVKEGEEAEENVVLAIGAYESAFLTDIIDSFVFEKMSKCFKVSKFRGIYHNDGSVILTGKWVKKDTGQ
eukprot:8864728-Ditylum_brightwellii.AAC.1